MIAKSILVALFATVVSGESIAFKKCPDATNQKDFAVPTSIDLSPCPSQPCVFKPGDTATIKIGFTAREDQTSLKASIHAYFMGVRTGFPMPNDDGCKDSGISCPISTGQNLTYTGTLAVLPIYPEIDAIVEWSLDSNGANSQKNQFCATFRIQIKK